MEDKNILLWLAGKYFSKLLGFDSYDDFIEHSLYLKINMTQGFVIDSHFGSLRFNKNILDGNIRREYKKFSSDYETNTNFSIETFIHRDYKAAAKEFFNRKNIIQAFKDGIRSNDMAFQVKTNDRLRWMQACYELRQEPESKDIISYFLIFDMDDFKRRKESIELLAERDRLTGLYNRNCVDSITAYFLAKPEETTAVFTFDIDDFKQLNDRYGHSFGDKIIVGVAQKITDFFGGETSVISRLGGDEFLAIVKDVSNRDAEKMAAAFTREPLEFQLDEKRIIITVSVGFSMYPEHGSEYKKLYKRADMALYSVKMNEKGSWKQFVHNLYKERRDSLGFNVAEISSGIPGGFLIYRADETGEILFANQDLIEMMECRSFDEFMEYTQGSFNHFVYPDDLEGVLYSINNQINQYKNSHDYVKYRIMGKNGKVRFVEDYGNLVHTRDNGDLFYVLLIDLENRSKLTSR